MISCKLSNTNFPFHPKHGNEKALNKILSEGSFHRLTNRGHGMKDDLGLYYYPNPLQKKFRMYVKEMHGEICFRMWNSEDPELWKTHGWVPYGAIREAAALYDGKTIDPKQAYDIEVAQALMKQGG